MSQESVIAVREFLDAAIHRDYEVALAAIHDDYRWTPDEFVEGPGETVIVSGVESARGRDSGIDVLSRRITGVYELRDRKIVRFKAYLDRHEALEAAGLRA